MAIQVKCGCGGAFSVKEQFAGRTGKCPHCGKGVTVPRPMVPADDGLLPLDLPAPRRAAGCHAHPEMPPNGACAICAKLLCARCVCNLEGTIYCQSCMTTAGAFRGGPRVERAEGLVTKSYKAYFNATRPFAALGSARLTVMNGWVLWPLMVALAFFLYYLQPIARHYSENPTVPYSLGIVQILALLFIECAFVACIRDALFMKEFGIARFFHYGARYFLNYFIGALAFWGILIAALVWLERKKQESGSVPVPALLGFIVAVIVINLVFAYARVLVVLENSGPFSALRRSVAFGIRHWGKVLVLAFICGFAGGVMLVKGVGIFFFLPEWAAIVVRNLFVFLAIGTQIAAYMVLYLSHLPDEESFKTVMPPDDVPETNGQVALFVSVGSFACVLGLAYWASHLPETQKAKTALNELGQAIIQAARPKAKLLWKAEADKPMVAGPVAVAADVLVCLDDRMERRRGSDGSVVWQAALPGKPETPPVHDGERAYVVCLWMGPETEEFKWGEPKQTLVAVGLGDGVKAWTVDQPRYADEAWLEPEIANDLVIVPSKFRLHAYSKTDGTERWATAESGMMLSVGPARRADDGIYYASQDDMIHVVDSADGREIRTMSNPALSLCRKPVVTADGVYTTARNTVIRFDRKTGRRSWEHNLGTDERNADSMRIEGIDGLLLYHFAWELRGLDPKNGQIAWILDVGDQYEGLDREGHEVRTERFFADAFANDGKSLVVLANDGKLLGHVDIKTGKRSDHADLPVETPSRRERREHEEEEFEGEDIREEFSDAYDDYGVGETGHPVIIGRTLIYIARGKLWAVELP